MPIDIVGALDELDAFDAGPRVGWDEDEFALAGLDYAAVGGSPYAMPAYAAGPRVGYMPVDIVGYGGYGAGYDSTAIGGDADGLWEGVVETGARSRPRMPVLSRGGPMLPAKQADLARRLAAARQIDPQAVAVVERAATKRKEFPIGFTQLAPTAPGAFGIVTAQPQVAFRMERFTVDSTIAPFFNITDIRVGKNSQFVDPNPVPASQFSEVGVGVRLSLDTSVPGILISIQFQNVDVVPRFFRASAIGTAVE